MCLQIKKNNINCLTCLPYLSLIYISIYAFGRNFFPKGLTLFYPIHLFLSQCNPWNGTHDLGVVNPMLFPPTHTIGNVCRVMLTALLGHSVYTVNSLFNASLLDTQLRSHRNQTRSGVVNEHKVASAQDKDTVMFQRKKVAGMRFHSSHLSKVHCPETDARWQGYYANNSLSRGGRKRQRADLTQPQRYFLFLSKA